MLKNILKNGLILGAISFICLSLVFTVSGIAKERIIQEKSKNAKLKYEKLLPKDSFNNDPSDSCYTVDISGKSFEVRIAKLNNKPTGYIVNYDVTGGYAVPFTMIAGIELANFSIHYADIEIFNETPGLGDKVLRKKGNYLDSFHGKNLKTNFEVKKYGGEFDYFTGATVTPRAVVRSTGNMLKSLSNIDITKYPECKGAK